MLKDNFFTFSSLQAEDNVVKTTITLNEAHPIFKGHFPGQPIVPGACMMQMVKEMVEVYVKKEIRLLKADDLKFLSFIDPKENRSIQMEIKLLIENELIAVDARLVEHDNVLFKFKGKFA
jgi:3-hydroxyacyl-[acyl-carrier-protein] dehydratase